MVTARTAEQSDSVPGEQTGCSWAGIYWRRVLWLLAGIGLLLSREAVAQTPPSQEYKVKAAFLFNFAQFVTWPTNVFAEPKSPLVIGIIGNDPFGRLLDEMVQGESVNDHPLVVQRYRRIEELKACHILFVGETDRKRLEDIFAQAKDLNILTVGDADQFIRQGGMIRFFTEGGKIRLEINLEAIKQSKLEVSSRLLRLARITPASKP